MTDTTHARTLADAIDSMLRTFVDKPRAQGGAMDSDEQAAIDQALGALADAAAAQALAAIAGAPCEAAEPMTAQRAIAALQAIEREFPGTVTACTFTASDYALRLFPEGWRPGDDWHELTTDPDGRPLIDGSPIGTRP